MALTVTELLWLRALLADFTINHQVPMSLFCDNQAALHIANNPVFRERTKHVEVDFHFVRDHVLAGDICTSYVASKDQVADLFTKALGNDDFHFLFLLRKLGTTEAEYRANEQVVEPACELRWKRFLLREIDVYQGDPMIMHCDNESAKNIDCRPENKERFNVLTSKLDSR